MWINFDQLLDLPNVTVVNYQKITQTIFLKLALSNETIECPNCHQTLDRINQSIVQSEICQYQAIEYIQKYHAVSFIVKGAKSISAKDYVL